MKEFVLVEICKDTINSRDKDKLFCEVMSYSKRASNTVSISKINKLKSYIKKNNLKNTPERFLILKSILHIESKIFTPKDIFIEVNKRLRVSESTINRAFTLLKHADIIQEVSESKMFVKTYYKLK